MTFDFKLALRGLRRSPGLLAAAILTLALGVGANVAIFSVIESSLLRPLPFRDPGRLAVLWEANPKMEGFLARRLPVAGRNFSEWRHRLTAFEQIESLRRSSENLTGNGRPEAVNVARVTSGFFQLFGRGPAQGRAFRQSDALSGSSGVAVVTAPLASRRRVALNDKLIVDGGTYTVVGIMPADFHLPALWQGREELLPDIYVPVAEDLAPPTNGELRRNYVFGRLRPGASLDLAGAQMSAAQQALAKTYPRLDSGFGANLFSITDEDLAPATRSTVLALQLAVLFVLLIACANVAHLMLTRVAAQSRDIAMRSALGASPALILRSALAECALIGAAGGILGLAVARAAIIAIDRLAPEASYHLHELSLDWRVFVFALAVTLFATLSFGITPAIAASRVNLRQALSQDARAGASRSTRRIHAFLIGAETAFAVILLAGAGLMLRSMVKLMDVNPGFRPSHVLTERIQLPATRYPGNPQVRAFCNQLLERVSAVPGVETAALATSLPMNDTLAIASYRLSDQPEPKPGERTMADYKGVSENYFQAIGATLLRGRLFIAADALADSPQTVIINDALAHQLSRFGDPLGRSLVIGPGPKIVIGIVAGARQMGLDTPERPEMFLPTRTIASMSLILRTTIDPKSAAGPAVASVWAIDPEQPVTRVWSLQEHLRRAMGQRRFDTALFAAFAALAILLAALGLYGVLSHAVAQRRHELGIRLALGAQPKAVKWLVIRGAMPPAVAGVIAGLSGAFLLTRAMESLLFEVAPADPLTFAGSAASLLLVAAFAAWLPGVRAARTNPMSALR